MAGSVELCYLSIAEASALMRDGELSPVELTQAFLQRIEDLGLGDTGVHYRFA